MHDQDNIPGPESRVNVCLLTETFHPVTGGGETQARVLASGLAASGAAVQVVTRRSDKSLARREYLGPVRLWRVSPSGAGQFRKWGLVITALITLLRLRHTYDVILVCGFRILGIPAVIAAGLLNKPCLLKADILGELSGEYFRAGLERFGLQPRGPLFRSALRLRNRLLRRASGFIAISTAVEEELIECGVDHERISHIPNSVDANRFSPVDGSTKHELRGKLGIPSSERIGIYTGRLERTKGLPLLLSAWKKIAGRHRDAHLLLVGVGGLGIHNCETELREFVVQNSLEQAVTFVGSVENVDEYLKASDFFIFPSEREAFGISVIEALACSLPVITTTAGGLSDIVTADRTAIVFPVGDVKALETAIERVLDDGAGFQEIAAAGRDRVVHAYSQSRIVYQYARLVASCHASGSDHGSAA
jgi:glycosyltransferase involved in cell wall biosynthesis